jgi:hypothetical protein
MSERNLEAVRRWHAAISSGPAECNAAIEALCDPDVDFYPVRKFTESRPCHGRDQLAGFFQSFWEGFAVTEFGLEEVVPVGDDRVFSRGPLRAEGAGSGIAIEGDLYTCHWLRHGRFIRIENHLTLSGALHAVGLEDGALVRRRDQGDSGS